MGNAVPEEAKDGFMNERRFRTSRNFCGVNTKIFLLPCRNVPDNFGPRVEI
jgi:hypothetical protein